MSDDIDPLDDEPDRDADAAAADALAHRINTLCHGEEVGTILWGLITVAATVIRSAAPDDIETQAGLFAAVANNIHAGLDAAEQPQGVIMVGDGATLDAEQVQAATRLCPMLQSLMTGLAARHDSRDVLNAWSSVLLVALMDNGIDRAQAILRGMLDGLPKAQAEREAHRAFDAQGNTGQVGRA